MIPFEEPDDLRYKQVKEALYNMDRDISENKNIIKEYRGIVTNLKALIDDCCKDIGDDLTGIKGANCRPAGKVDNPRTITTYNPSHPYMVAMYDLSGGRWG